MELITSTSNIKIKMARSLRMKKFRDELGMFIAEGIHHVGAAFEADWQIDSVFYDPDHLTSDYGLGLIDRMLDRKIPCFPVSREVFGSISEKENTLGMIATVHKNKTSIQELRTETLLVAMVTPQDPGNVGALVRTMDSTGGGGLILLDGGVDQYHPTLIRASMGTFFWTRIVSLGFFEMVDWAKKEEFHIIGTSARGSDLRQATLPVGKKVILFGSEQKGLDPDQVMACDMLLSLPMMGHNSSLNLSVAAGIILYKITGLI